MRLKNSFPFKLATTSFIYPDHIIPNVEKLGPIFDEIELLLFESRPFIKNGRPVPVLPSIRDIKVLAHLNRELDITYNVHLPVDISLTDISRSKREKGVDTVKKIVELCEPINPTTHTLHLNLSDEDAKGGKKGILYWQERAAQSLSYLASFLSNPGIISIETLEYPFEYLYPLIDNSGMSLCIDAGHLIKCEFNIIQVFEKYRSQIPLIHLHGVDYSSGSPKDHQSLDKTPQDRFKSTMEVLKQFHGVVSIEVFNYQMLGDSIKFMNHHF